MLRRTVVAVALALTPFCVAADDTGVASTAARQTAPAPQRGADSSVPVSHKAGARPAGDRAHRGSRKAGKHGRHHRKGRSAKGGRKFHRGARKHHARRHAND